MIRTAMTGVFALAAAFSGTAQAQGKPQSVLVLPLEHDGLNAQTAAALSAEMRKVARATFKGRLLPVPALDFADLQIAAGCIDPSAQCLSNIGRTLKAARVVRVLTQGSARRLQFKILVVRTKAGRGRNYEMTLNDVDAQSSGEFGWHLRKAFGGDPAPLTGGLKLYMASKLGNLQGAEIRVDDRTVITRALDRLTPGRHRIEIRQTGFETFIWMGDVRPLRVTRVPVRFEIKQVLAKAPPPSVELAPDTTPPITADPVDMGPSTESPAAPAASDRPRLVMTWVFGATSLVALSAGAIFAAQTQNLESRAVGLGLTCVAPDDGHEVCVDGRARQTQQFIAWGAALGLGAAAVAAFFLEEGPEIVSRDSAKVSVGLGPTRGGMAASLQVDF